MPSFHPLIMCYLGLETEARASLAYAWVKSLNKHFKYQAEYIDPTTVSFLKNQQRGLEPRKIYSIEQKLAERGIVGQDFLDFLETS